MFAYRVDKKKYVGTLLQGLPGAESDFRWNTKGHPIIYASYSRSLALHEKSGNMSKPFYGLSTSYVLAVIELPDLSYKRILQDDLPDGWDLIGAYHPKTQEIGDAFSLSVELALFVPSTIVNGEFNVLINPNKAMILNLKITTEAIDERLRDLR